MKKLITIIFIIFFSVSCNAQRRIAYTYEEFKTEFNSSFDVALVPIGDYFWDEFNVFKTQYNLTENESKLLGKWMNVTFLNGPVNNYFTFFPNRYFILDFKYLNYNLFSSDKLFLNKAIGTWEIVNDTVRITIYSILTEDKNMDSPNNKDIILIDKPYTVNFININDIGEEGFTKRPINDKIFSKELLKMVNIKEPNKTNNLYVRNIYTIHVIPEFKNNYGYFTYFPEMAKNNHSGLEIATNPELIKKYIPDWMF